MAPRSVRLAHKAQLLDVVAPRRQGCLIGREREARARRRWRALAAMASSGSTIDDESGAIVGYAWLWLQLSFASG